MSSENIEASGYSEWMSDWAILKIILTKIWENFSYFEHFDNFDSQDFWPIVDRKLQCEERYKAILADPIVASLFPWLSAESKEWILHLIRDRLNLESSPVKDRSRDTQEHVHSVVEKTTWVWWALWKFIRIFKRVISSRFQG